MLPPPVYVTAEREARIPPGVVRYCWEEPIVALHQTGPGLGCRRKLVSSVLLRGPGSKTGAMETLQAAENRATGGRKT